MSLTAAEIFFCMNLLDEILDPAALSQQRRNLHHSFAVLQEVRVEVGVEELTGSHGCGACRLLVDV